MNKEVNLETFCQNDILNLIRWIDSEKLNLIWASKRFEYPLQEEALKQHFSPNQDDILFFKVLNSANNQAVGHVELSNIDKKEKTATLSRVLIGGEFRGQGFGKTLLEKAITYAKNDLKLKTLNLTVFSFNQKAISLYQYLGFQTTGIEKNYVNVEGEFWHRQAMKLQF